MKNVFLIATLLFISVHISAQNIGIGTLTPDASAALEIKDTTRGLLIPRMTMQQRIAITSPGEGLMVFQTDSTKGFWYYSTGKWKYNVLKDGAASGDMMYWNGNAWTNLPGGQHGQPLYFCNGVPTWGGCAPMLTTATASSITSNSASSGGNITSDGGSSVTARGICWNTVANPTIALATKTTDGAGIGAFTSSITGLSANTTYHVRAYATNSVGTNYGGDSVFTSSFQPYSYVAGPNITDINGNIYPSITNSCGQTYITKNLNVSRYRNGNMIPQVTDQTQWENLTTGAWCWYENDSATYWQYGKLYNWYAVNDPRGLAPLGWHVPSASDFNKLIKCIDVIADTSCQECNLSLIAADDLKETGTSHWPSPNSANNNSGLNILPSGIRFGMDGGVSFFGIRESAFIWSSSQNSTNYTGLRIWLYYLNTKVSMGADNPFPDPSNKLRGYSVRLVKD